MFLRYTYIANSTACPDGKRLYSEHEECQNEKNADKVAVGDTTECYIDDMLNDCSSGLFAWAWDIKSLKYWGTVRIVCGSIGLPLACCCLCCIFLAVAPS